MILIFSGARRLHTVARAQKSRVPSTGLTIKFANGRAVDWDFDMGAEAELTAWETAIRAEMDLATNAKVDAQQSVWGTSRACWLCPR